MSSLMNSRLAGNQTHCKQKKDKNSLALDPMKSVSHFTQTNTFKFVKTYATRNLY